MTTKVGRLSGALIVETEISGECAWFLVGHTKAPCDFHAAGFATPAPPAAPGERDTPLLPCVRLVPLQNPRIEGALITIAANGEGAARLVAERLLVSRNGSVSERLWRLIFGSDDDEPSGELDARWLGEMPARIWDVVRDTVLKCT